MKAKIEISGSEDSGKIIFDLLMLYSSVIAHSEKPSMSVTFGSIKDAREALREIHNLLRVHKRLPLLLHNRIHLDGAKAQIVNNIIN